MSDDEIGARKEINFAFCPHFAINTKVELPTKSFGLNQVDKISFYFGQLMTSWISSRRPDNTHLHTVHFLFIYSGDRIIDFHWHAEYESSEEGAEGEVLALLYEWNQFVEKDEVGSLATFLISTFTMTSFLFVYIISSATPFKSRGLPTRRRSGFDSELPTGGQSGLGQTVPLHQQLRSPPSPQQQIQPPNQHFISTPNNLSPPIQQQQPHHELDDKRPRRGEHLLEPFSEEEISSFVGGASDLGDTIPQSTESKEE